MITPVSILLGMSYIVLFTDYPPVRELLNKGFYETAFSAEEKKQIITSHLVTPENKVQRVDGGPDTEDKVIRKFIG